MEGNTWQMNSLTHGIFMPTYVVDCMVKGLFPLLYNGLLFKIFFLMVIIEHANTIFNISINGLVCAVEFDCTLIFQNA